MGTINLLTFYVPKSHLNKVKTAIFKAGGGSFANYSECSFETKGIGQFRPTSNSTPYLGKIGKLTKVVEYKVDIMVEEKNLKKVVTALKKSHPYEVPSFFVLKSNS